MLPFPFSVARLTTGAWPRPAEEPREQNRLAKLFSRVTVTPARASICEKTASQVFSMAILAIFLVLVGPNRTLARDSSSGHGLQVKRDGQHFLIAWDPSDPEIASAKGAQLQIWEGNGPPSMVLLTSAQLRAGTLAYGAVPFIERTRFRLELIQASGEAVFDSAAQKAPSMATASTSPELNTRVVASDPPSTPARFDHIRSSRKSTPASAEEDLLPSGPISTWRQAESMSAEKTMPRVESELVPSEPAETIRSLGTAPRSFVPPQPPRRSNVVRETVMPEPPKIAPAMTSRGIPLVLTNTSVLSASMGNGFQDPDATRTAPGNQPTTGVVTITSEPSGANVAINEVPAGSTPLTVRIFPVGVGFTVTVSKSGFMKWMVQSVATARPYSLNAQLKIPKGP